MLLRLGTMKLIQSNVSFVKELQLKSCCSLSALTADPKQSYEEFGGAIKKFQSIKKIPVDLRVEKLESGGDIGEALYRNKAKFPKT